MKKLIHIDLFSGIGGFALAVDAVWPNAEHVFCDNNYFCQQAIKKHWPGSCIYHDIREFTSDPKGRKSGKQAEQEGREDISRGNSKGNTQTKGNSEPARQEAFLLTGGFP